MLDALQEQLPERVQLSLYASVAEQELELRVKQTGTGHVYTGRISGAQLHLAHQQGLYKFFARQLDAAAAWFGHDYNIKPSATRRAYLAGRLAGALNGALHGLGPKPQTDATAGVHGCVAAAGSTPGDSSAQGH